MSTIQAFLLGLLQGLTEFLPISSSGHLAIGKRLLGLDAAVVDSPVFEVVVHIATALSIIVVFRREIGAMLKGACTLQWNQDTQYMTKIAVAVIPIAIVGVCFKDNIESLFAAGMPLVGAMLLLTSALLLLTHFYRPRVQRPISYVDALVIGVVQCIALLPGLSRSGSTIAASLLRGNDRAYAAQFSFLIVLPPILGEALIGIAKGEFVPAESGIDLLPMAVGFLTAFIAGALACRFMLTIVRRCSLIWFAIYCAAVGIAALLLI
jgi:undecaprenyl-diphosphatase